MTNMWTVLIIDDEESIRTSLGFFLEDCGYKVLTAGNGRVGIEIISAEKPDVVLTDLRMPEVDGLEVLKTASLICPDTPVIVISGTGRIQDVVEALHLGAWDYLLKPVEDLNVLSHLLTKAVDRVALIRENREYQRHLEDLVSQRTKELELTNQQLELSRRQIIAILSEAAEYRDFETGTHFLRVAAFCACIARSLGWDEEAVTCIELASPVHDIGKIGIPDHILMKNGPLDGDEWTEMKKHCQYGEAILRGRNLPAFFMKDGTGKGFLQNSTVCEMLENAANIALYHHEQWDGSGYPSGISGETIPIQARITAVADVYDAISSKRPYKEPWPRDKCVQYVRDQAGKMFDPEIVEVFLNNLETIYEIQNHYRD